MSPIPIRVFALGDSYTQGTGLSADSSYPFQLDLELNQDDSGLYEPRFAVINLGLAAFGAEQSLLALRRFAETVGRPNACLYLGAENDYGDDLLFRAGYRHAQIVEGSPRWGWTVRPLLWAGRFEVFKRLKIAISGSRRRRIFSSAATPSDGPAQPAASPAELSWPVLGEIQATCREFGAPL